jgi:hypothetical protein
MSTEGHNNAFYFCRDKTLAIRGLFCINRVESNKRAAISHDQHRTDSDENSTLSVKNKCSLSPGNPSK